MSGEGERVRLEFQLEGVESVPAALLASRALALGLDEVRVERWATSAKRMPEGGTVVSRTRHEGAETVLFERDDLLVQVHLMTGFVSVTIAGRDAETVDEALRALQADLPAPDPSARQEVQVTFWTYGPHGPHPAWRSIAVPTWEEIEVNYSSGTHAHLRPLMRDFQPARGGQLVLWHGEAGTGKTYALRALAWEWREWCEFHYIVDPDRFFGEHADYLMSVLLQHEGLDDDFDEEQILLELGPAPPVGGWSPVGSGPPGGRPKPWKLLMLEDTGELLTPDARSLIGQGLSRFLNVVDGLIGQGLRVLVLVTTNEEIRKLHPAVARSGRAAANVLFGRVGVEAANAWLERYGSSERVTAPTTLAMLYALAEGSDAREPEVGPGFGGA